jgi:hypothetical protein
MRVEWRFAFRRPTHAFAVSIHVKTFPRLSFRTPHALITETASRTTQKSDQCRPYLRNADCTLAASLWLNGHRAFESELCLEKSLAWLPSIGGWAHCLRSLLSASGSLQNLSYWCCAFFITARGADILAGMSLICLAVCCSFVTAD